MNLYYLFSFLFSIGVFGLLAYRSLILTYISIAIIFSSISLLLFLINNFVSNNMAGAVLVINFALSFISISICMIALYIVIRNSKDPYKESISKNKSN